MVSLSFRLPEHKRVSEHPRRYIYPQPLRNGSGAHLIELCEDCGANVRGLGRWVPRAEVPAQGIDPDQLPIAPERSAAAVPDLFNIDLEEL